MFTIKGAVSNYPEVDWNEDGSTVDLEFELDEIEFKIRRDDAATGRVRLSLPRSVAYFLWGNLDKQLVTELRAFEADGTPSPRLAEVRKALGVPDEDED